MAVGYSDPEPPADPALIERLEQQLGRPLPASYRRYLEQQDGGRLEENSEVVDEIFGLGDDVPDFARMWDVLETFDGRVPSWLLPVARDVYGNLFTISLRDSDQGSVWFWDHEEEADEDEPPSEENVTYKATDWLTFLDGLTPLT
jgi:hypothetical protein